MKYIKRKKALLYILTFSLYSTLCLGQNSFEISKPILDNGEHTSKLFNILDQHYTFFTYETENSLMDFFEFPFLDSAHYIFADSSSTVKKYARDSVGAFEFLRVDLDEKDQPYHVHLSNRANFIEIPGLTPGFNRMNSLCLQIGQRGKIKSIVFGLDSTALQAFEFLNDGQLHTAHEYVSDTLVRSIEFYINLFSRSSLERISNYFDDISVPASGVGNHDPYSYFNINVSKVTNDCLHALGQVHDLDLHEEFENAFNEDVINESADEIRSISAICKWNDDGTGEVTRYYLSGEKRAFGNVDEQGNPIGIWTYLKPTGEIKKIKNYATRLR